MPIDHFMRALAEEHGNRAIGVILSGTGTDGTLGMAEIQAQGGVTFAQDGGSARSSERCSPDPCQHTDRYRLVTPFALRL